MDTTIREELFNVVRALEEANVDYAVCGGIALVIHGFVRMTKDIDMLVRPRDVQKAKDAVRSAGFTLSAAPMTFGIGTEREIRVHRVSKPMGDVLLTLDLLEVGLPLKEIWKGRRKLKLQEGRVKVVSREGLAVMKRRAGRPQDLVDLLRLEEAERGSAQ